jgi:GntR family transcriptional regulator
MTKPPLSAEPAPTFRPLYLQIKDLLVRSLETGEWRPGEAIASEIVLASRFGVSQGTVRKAIDALAADHLVVRRQGKGTFVATHTEEAQSSFRFLRIRQDGGGELPASRLIDVRRGKASVEVARLLELKPGDPVVVVRRVLEWGGRPVIVDDITLPAALYPGLNERIFTGRDNTIYHLYQSRYGINVLRTDERLRAGLGSGPVAALLGVEPGAPLLEIRRVALTFRDRPVELRVSRVNTASHVYHNTFGKGDA